MTEQQGQDAQNSPENGTEDQQGPDAPDQTNEAPQAASTWPPEGMETK